MLKIAVEIERVAINAHLCFAGMWQADCLTVTWKYKKGGKCLENNANRSALAFKQEVEFVSQNLGLGYLASYLQKYGTTWSLLTRFLRVSASHHHCLQNTQKYWGGAVGRRNCESHSSRYRFHRDYRSVHRFAFCRKSALKKNCYRFPQHPVDHGRVYPSTLPEEALSFREQISSLSVKEKSHSGRLLKEESGGKSAGLPLRETEKSQRPDGRDDKRS